MFSFNLFAQEKEKFLTLQPKNYVSISGNRTDVNSSVNPDDIHAYVFPIEEPFCGPKCDFPNDKRELAEYDEVYLDENSFGIFMHGWPCGDYIGENWVFEFISPDGTVKEYTIEYGDFGYYNWRIDYFYYIMFIREPWHCFFHFNWDLYDFGFFKHLRCFSNMVGDWVLNFKHSGTVIKTWYIKLNNIDRGWIEIKMPDPKPTILPDGLEIERGISAGGDSTNLTVSFNTCEGPKEGQSISFEQQFINNTGGHNHDEPQTCQSTNTHPYCGIITPSTVTTDKNGMGQIQFTAPYYSGKIEIRARTTYKEYEREAKTEVDILVPGLLPLSGSMVLVPDNENCVHGAANNYYQPGAIDKLQDLAASWYNSKYNPNHQLLRFTAGSLPLGGKFDDGVCWSEHNDGNHLTHRTGWDADISTRYPDGTYMNQNAFRQFIKDRTELHLQVIHYDTAHTHVRYIP